VASGASLWRTVNGARTWRRVLSAAVVGTNWYGLVRCDHASVWFLVYGASGVMNQDAFVLYGSTGPAGRWRPFVDEAFLSSAFHHLGPVVSATGYPAALWVDGRTAYLAGNSAAGNWLASVHGGRAQVWHLGGVNRSNGGWGPVALSSGTSGPLWAAVDVDNTGSVLLTTRDFGTYWREAWPSSALTPVDAVSAPSLRDLVGLGTLGDPGAVLASSDGGLRWRQVGQFAGRLRTFFWSFSALSMLKSGTGWAVFDSSLYASNDGGRTWRFVHVTSAMRAGGITAAQRLSPSTGWALTSQGALWATANGGRDWREVHRGFIQVDCLSGACRATDGESTYRASAPARPWRLVGAGNSAWVVPSGDIPPPYTLPPADGPGVGSVQFLGRDGWATTGNALLSTRDGGRSWQIVN